MAAAGWEGYRSGNRWLILWVIRKNSGPALPWRNFAENPPVLGIKNQWGFVLQQRHSWLSLGKMTWTSLGGNSPQKWTTKVPNAKRDVCLFFLFFCRTALILQTGVCPRGRQPAALPLPPTDTAWLMTGNKSWTIQTTPPTVDVWPGACRSLSVPCWRVSLPTCLGFSLHRTRTLSADGTESVHQLC